MPIFVRPRPSDVQSTSPGGLVGDPPEVVLPSVALVDHREMAVRAAGRAGEVGDPQAMAVDAAVTPELRQFTLKAGLDLALK